MPDGIPNVDGTVLKLAEQYQSTLVRSRALNEERAQIRENVDKLGIDPKAFQVGLMMTRDMTAGERQDYTGSLNRVIAALDGRESDLFGADEVAKRDKRAEKRAAKGKPADEPDNPRGDPKKGGAGGVDGKGKAKDAAAKPVEPKVTGRRGKKGGDNVVTLKQATKASDKAIKDSLANVAGGLPEVPADDPEQAEGAAVLDGAIDRIKAGAGDNPVENDIPKSQSQISKEKLEAAKLN